MNGQQLYALYARAYLESFNCGVPPWDDLNEDDRQAWERFAELVEET